VTDNLQHSLNIADAIFIDSGRLVDRVRTTFGGRLQNVSFGCIVIHLTYPRDNQNQAVLTVYLSISR